jgi:hypothetical protein
MLAVDDGIGFDPIRAQGLDDRLQLFDVERQMPESDHLLETLGRRRIAPSLSMKNSFGSPRLNVRERLKPKCFV